MADKHPYISGSAGISKAIGHLRKQFPAQVTAETLKKLSIAPNNETYVINILRFIGVLDTEFKKTEKASTVFNKHNDEDFQKSFSEMIKQAYSDLFALHGDDSWQLSTDALISYFRNTDQSSALVGQRQATTFQALASLGGKSVAPPVKSTNTPVKKSTPEAKPSPKPKVPESAPQTSVVESPKNTDMALTVRVEINLPPAADQKTYDYIFKSIRENLLNG